ncbi:chalcone isomerase family protein [Thalassolituus oleivorans]|uniref:Chalcone isomerase domain-containing protein n=1 Tax=Thalassolituus oleivorans MIL-1 TaxID=1298593 RepID=M5DQ04_9GAMM|nr:chalcone isomerase family protein [Thalassolituus oleivorans]CCU72005.1 hypothetical protein TOL_1580 [Thalassolituus oleivorans MIL-1]
MVSYSCLVRWLLGVVLSILIISGAQALKVEGINIENELPLLETPLVLKGAGVRTKFFYHLYVCALYLPEDTAADEDLDILVYLSADKPLAMRIYIISDMITADRFADAAHEGFVQATHGNTAPIQNEIETMVGAFRTTLQNHDVFDLVYDPERGVVIYRNSEEQAVVPGAEFKKAMFAIWLGDDPVQSKLKRDMLGDN